MTRCLYCPSDAALVVINKGSLSVKHPVCIPCYRSRKDGLIVIERLAASEDPGEDSP